MNLWAVVPVKRLHSSKSRLANVLSAQERAALTQKTCRHVITALQGVRQITHILVVTRDPLITETMTGDRVELFAEPEQADLNGSLKSAMNYALENSADGVLIVPSDLAIVECDDLARMVVRPDKVVICSDRRFDGTNAIIVRGLPRFRFRFGDDSFTKHLQEAAGNGTVANVFFADSIQFDLDTPADYFHFLEHELKLQEER